MDLFMLRTWSPGRTWCPRRGAAIERGILDRCLLSPWMADKPVAVCNGFGIFVQVWVINWLLSLYGLWICDSLADTKPNWSDLLLARKRQPRVDVQTQEAGPVFCTGPDGNRTRPSWARWALVGSISRLPGHTAEGGVGCRPERGRSQGRTGWPISAAASHTFGPQISRQSFIWEVFEWKFSGNFFQMIFFADESFTNKSFQIIVSRKICVDECHASN